MNTSQKKFVHLYVFDKMVDWEASYAVGGINDPMFQKNPNRYSVKTVGLSKDPVTTAGGIRILPDLSLDELDLSQSAMLILPGGTSWDRGLNGEVIQKAQDFISHGIPVAAICGATAGMARAGLLDNVKHTSNALIYLQATQYKGSSLYVEQPAVTDNLVITAGGTASLEFAYNIFQKLDIYSADVLDAWYGLYKTGEEKYFYALMKCFESTSES